MCSHPVGALLRIAWLFPLVGGTSSAGAAVGPGLGPPIPPFLCALLFASNSCHVDPTSL